MSRKSSKSEKLIKRQDVNKNFHKDEIKIYTNRKANCKSEEQRKNVKTFIMTSCLHIFKKRQMAA